MENALDTGGSERDARAAVAANPLWYHTMDLAPGVSTPGWFDLRSVLEKLPWPDVAGRRCLDVGTYDGQLAFELERRGASEVVATDIADHELWDWPPRIRSQGVEYLRTAAGERKGIGFEIARDLLQSSVTRVQANVYDLDPADLGEFDVVVCGSLLLHLRDPLRALDAIRSVCREQLMCTNEVVPNATLGSRRPAAILDGMTDQLQWWIPNPAGHARMVEAVGFDIDTEVSYREPYGPAHPSMTGPAAALDRIKRKLAPGREGVLHHAILARPLR